MARLVECIPNFRSAQASAHNSGVVVLAQQTEDHKVGDKGHEQHLTHHNHHHAANQSGQLPKLQMSGLDVMKNVTAILICMAVGTMVSGWIGKLIGMSFPTYVGAMFVAVIVRNLNEVFHFYNFSFSLVDGIGDVMLSLYLSIALMTLKSP